MLGEILGFISAPVKGWQDRKTLKLEHKQELDTAVHNLKVAEVNAQQKRVSDGQTQDYNLDKIAMDNMEKSYKDEFILFVFMVPMILAFIPEMAQYVHAGFGSIALMPDWYKWLLIGMIAVIYGMRGMLKQALGLKKFFSRGGT